MGIDSEKVRLFANAVGCSTTDLPILASALTHESSFGADPDQRGNYDKKALLSLLGSIGESAFEALAAEDYIFSDKFSAASDTVAYIRDLQSRFYEPFVMRFGLLSLYVMDKGLVKTLKGSGLNQSALIREIAERACGAITATTSYDNVKQLLRSVMSNPLNQHCPSTLDNLRPSIRDAKSCLQEIAQRLYRKPCTYEQVASSGPDHQKVFISRVVSPSGVAETGSGQTIKSAEQEAARKLILNKGLSDLAPDIIKRYAPRRHEFDKEASAPPKKLAIAPAAVQAAKRLAPTLGCEFLKMEELALALTVSSDPRLGVCQTNFRHKFFGSVLDRLSLQLYCYHNLFQEIVSTPLPVPTIAPFLAKVLSAQNYVQLFNHLELSRYIQGQDNTKLKARKMADVVQAISAALYMSAENYKRYYEWISGRLGPWVTKIINDLGARPWRLLEPKGLLQSLMQATGCFELGYSARIGGPDHAPNFKAEVHCTRQGEHNVHFLGRGQGETKSSAETRAAEAALIAVLPRVDRQNQIPVAADIWRACFDNAAKRNGRLPFIGLPVHLAMFKCCRAYSELRAFVKAFPNLSALLKSEPHLATIVRSAEFSNPFPLLQIRKATEEGIRLWTEISPDDSQKFLSFEVNVWLDRYRKLSHALKLPSANVQWPHQVVDLGDLEHMVRMKRIRLMPLKNTLVPAESVSHVLNILECLDDELEDPVAVSLQHRKADERHVITLALPICALKHNLIKQILNNLGPQAFFMGIEDSLHEIKSNFVLLLQTVAPEKESVYSQALYTIISKLFKRYEGVRALYRVIHDLKNQFISIQNYARQATTDSSLRFQTLGKIERLQREIQGRQASLGALFNAYDESSEKVCEISTIFREFAAQELYTLPQNIRLKLDSSIDPGMIEADPVHLFSLLTNLCRNAVEAMAEGGELAFSAHYKKAVGELLVEFRDTGQGIPEDVLANLFTGLRSTKKGMGLGLATVNQIVRHYGGKVDVDSKLGAGTTVTVMLPFTVHPN